MTSSTTKTDANAKRENERTEPPILKPRRHVELQRLQPVPQVKQTGITPFYREQILQFGSTVLQFMQTLMPLAQ